jgi:TPR repeat protein
MKIRLIYMLLFMLPTAFAGEVEYKEPSQAKPESDEIKEWRKIISENPELEKMLQKNLDERKSEADKEKQEASAAVATQKKARDFTPSKDIADEAFKKGDYKEALKHYEALGEDGDSNASLAAGLIHGEGAGDVEQDKAKATAWFNRSGDQGEIAGTDLHETMDEDELTEEDKAKAEKYIRQFREEDSIVSKNQQELTTGSQAPVIHSSIYNSKSYQYPSKSTLVQLGDTNSYAASTDIEANYLPLRSSSSEYSYQPERAMQNHYLPERE